MKTVFLQLDSILKHPDFFVMLILFIVLIVVCMLITRAIFSIPAFLKYNKAQTLLLVKIARAQGVPENEIDNVLDILDPRDKPNVHPDNKIRHVDTFNNNK